MQPIIVVETLEAVTNKTAALRQALLDLAPLVHQEKGCLQYDIAESAEGANSVLVLMRWETLADLDAHEQSDLIAEFVKKYDQILYHTAQQTVWGLCSE